MNRTDKLIANVVAQLLTHESRLPKLHNLARGHGRFVRIGRSVLFTFAPVLLLGCVKQIAVSSIADSLAEGGQVYASDDDPELIKASVPFGLKVIESLLAEAPDNKQLLLAAGSGFTQYAYAFVQQEAEELEPTNRKRADELYARAKRLFRRARGYGLRGLDSAHPGFLDAFAKNRGQALEGTEIADVPLLYWTAISWAAEISLSKDDMALVGELPIVEALMGRALALDESFDNGALHEFYAAYDGARSEAMGGSIESARKHFERAVQLSRGEKMTPFLTWAETVSVRTQDKLEFEKLLKKVLAFDEDKEPRFRLMNLIAKARAERLLARSGDLFLED